MTEDSRRGAFRGGASSAVDRLRRIDPRRSGLSRSSCAPQWHPALDAPPPDAPAHL